MNIELFWDDLKILTIEKKDNLFISSVDSDNLMKAKDAGFPTYFLRNISLVSEELAPIVRNRIPGVNKIQDKLKFKGNCSEEDIEENICEYINTTECRRPTDKISIKIELN